MTALTSLVRAGALALEPLERALADPGECGRLLAEVGYEVSLSPAAHAKVAGLLPVVDELRSLPAGVAALEDGGAAAVLELVETTAAIVRTIAELASLERDDLTGLPGPLSLPETWTDLATALGAHLLAGRLARQAPAAFAALRLTGVCRSEGPGDRPRYVFDWDGLGPALANPADAVKAAIGWGGPFNSWPVQRELGLLLARLGFAVRTRAVQPAVAEAITGAPVEDPAGVESDVVLFRGVTAAGVNGELGLLFACTPDGGGTLYVGNLAYGAAGIAIPLSETWTLEASATADGAATIGARIQPAGVSLVGADAAIGAAIALEARPPAAWLLLGSANATRVELDGLRLEIGITGTTAEPEAYVLAGIEQGAFRFVLDLGAADSFLRGVIGDAIPAITAGGELRWGTSAGLTFGGGVGLEVVVPIDKDAGPLHVESLTLSLGAGDTGARLAATVVAGLTIGPFTGTVGGIGAAVELSPDPDGDGLGGLAAQVLFIGPTRIDLVIALEEVVTGGGFVDHDPALGRYTGAVALDFPAVGLGAIVIVDTRLPGDPDGWALLASIFATFPSLPLGFGFFLSGVGGLVCLNRTLDGDALASGLKSGAIDAILFPDDPREDAALILSQLDAWFPPAEGSAVFGIAAEITWGTPVPIVTGQLGVALVLPDLEIAVMGSVAMVLPSADEVLLELHMDSLGMIDVPGGTVTVVASLYDSALLSTIHLSGDMAFYVSVGAAPYFLLSVGGYHPSFDPPCGLPPSVLALDRMRAEVTISDDVLFALEAYVAVTANTLQFGSLATLEASAEFLLTTYTARGSVGFDVLLVFSPFSFSAAFQLSVSVTAGEKELLAVDLAAQLDGPDPWYTSGYARFEFFGIGVRFDFEFGGAAQPETPARQDVCGLVVAALDSAAAWRAAQPAWADTTVLTFAADEDEDPAELWVRPDAELEARQTLAPLDRGLDHYGVFDIDGPTTLGVTGAGIEGVIAGDDWNPLVDWFAPAQYDDLTRAEKLAAPSYEEMTTGVRFSAGGLGFDAAEATTVVPDFEVRILDEDDTRPLGALPAAVPLTAATVALGLDPARPRPIRAVTSATFAVGAPTWQTFDPLTGAPVGSPQTYRAAQRALDAARAADPGTPLRLAPTHAAEAVA